MHDVALMAQAILLNYWENQFTEENKIGVRVKREKLLPSQAFSLGT